MKALSIKQPWASLIAHDIKDIENRTWKTNFRGRVYIHASAKSVKGYINDILTTEQFKSIDRNIIDNLLFVPTSAIIGEVDIVDCVINHPSIWAEKTKSIEADNENLYGNFVGKPIYNWVLANPVLYEKPILNVKGKLSFWEPDIDIEECIGCSGKFDYETMQQDNAGENYCPECAAEMFPVMKAEYDKMVRNGEIEE